VSYLDRIIYVDEKGNRSVHLDYSILSTFSTCKEKARLAYVLHLAPKVEERPLSYGSAIHAGLSALDTTGDVEKAVEAFIAKLQEVGSALPVEIENAAKERRSIERGSYVIRAYAERWSSDPYEQAYSADGKPLAEIGFSIFLREFQGIPIMLSGKIDDIKKSKVDGQLYNWERKTSTGSVYSVLANTRPNHQITTYDFAVKTLLGLKLSGTALDAIYISDRLPAPKKGGWFTYGIDIEKDFGREFTVRSETDIEEFLFDLDLQVTEFLQWASGDLRRWTRNAPTACSMYGGCKFKAGGGRTGLCNTNLNQNVIETEYEVKPWHPWALEGKKET